MKRWFWSNGRLAWPIVAAIMLATLFLLVADLAWRVLVMPAEELAAVVVSLLVVVVMIFIGVHLLSGRQKRPS